MILTLRTDKPESEIGLYDGETQLAYETWQAHRQLAETIHKKIQELLSSQDKELSDVTGIVIYQGPGSFTGLRIGMSVGNALAYSLEVPIVAVGGEDWVKIGGAQLQDDGEHKYAVPDYGAPAATTQPRK